VKLSLLGNPRNFFNALYCLRCGAPIAVIVVTWQPQKAVQNIVSAFLSSGASTSVTVIASQPCKKSNTFIKFGAQILVTVDMWQPQETFYFFYFFF